MKIYLSKINESWIVDRVRREWYLNNKSISTKFLNQANIVWIISPWLWKKIPKKHLESKKVLCSIYHLDFNQKNNNDLENLIQMEPFVDEFHVISNRTKDALQQFTDKKITSIPFWVNQDLWFSIVNKKRLKEELKIDSDKYLIGSFQRDTEGHDLKSPKLIKGPDIFFDIVKEKFSKNQNIEVILAGKRRQYLINRLTNDNIPFKYFEMVDLKKLNKLYNVLDLYIVSSRIEGGPQAIVECGLTKTPIISTDVGIASEILHKKSIFNVDNYNNAEPNVEHAYKNSELLTIPNGMKRYIKMFKAINEN